MDVLLYVDRLPDRGGDLLARQLVAGAGDAHVAALLARLSLGDDPARAAWVANVAASLAVERAGPATGPTANELGAALEQA